ncbi:hypothetical protein GCM10009839_69210 [Catenulispora yoronensis]|uniref:Tc1-like transposase DDE domain-containing protein n=1 Tax=Catenulispora yoronensis TaxID=450799 RepID=A0ABN2V5M5_9ACTN
MIAAVIHDAARRMGGGVDAQRAYLGAAAQVMAIFQNMVIALLSAGRDHEAHSDARGHSRRPNQDSADPGCIPTMIKRLCFHPAMGRRDPVSMISAIEQRGRIHFTSFTGICDKAAFIKFCQQLLADDGGADFLILDNAPVHRSKDVKAFAEKTDGRLKLFFLPGCCPTLNPDGWVWSNVKAAGAGQRAARIKGEVFCFAIEALERLATAPEILCGFFRDPTSPTSTKETYFELY